MQNTAPVNLQNLLDKLKTFIKQKDVFFEEWFGQFDRLNSGRCYIDQFRRAMSQIRYEISDEEFDLLIKTYAKGDRVNYRQFCHDIETIFTKRELEKKPLEYPEDAKAVISRTLGKIMTNEDSEALNVIKKLYHQAKTRGLNLREDFMDFDRHNIGHVTQSQFSRCQPFRDLTASDLAFLYKRYSDPVLKDFNYRKLMNDINDYQNSLPSQTIQSKGYTNFLPHQSSSFHYQEFDKKPEELLPKFADLVKKNRIRIKDFFQSHDTFNCGHIPKSKFEGVLTLFGFPFTQNDIDRITREYHINVDSTDYVRYRDFVKDVEALGEQLTSPESLKARAMKAPIETRGDEKLKSLIDKIKTQIVRYRINALPTIQDFDRYGRGYITKIQLHRALATLGINISNEESEILAREYTEQAGLDYFRFIEDVDPTHIQKRRDFRPLNTSRESIESIFGKTPTGDLFVTPDKADEMIYKSKRGLYTKINEHKDIDSLLTDIRKWAYINGIIFQEFFISFDPLNIGEIHKSHFRSGLSISTYNITEDEFDTLCEYYKSPTKQDWVCWRKFDEDIKSFNAPLDLEKTPQVNPVNPADMTRRITARDHKSMTPQIKQLMEQIAKFVKTRRLSLIDQFRGQDLLNHKKVTAISFTRVLQLIGVYMSKDNVDKLASFYNDPHTNFVDYHRFCRDVSEITGLVFGDNASDSIVPKPIPHYMDSDTNFLVSVRASPRETPTWESLKKKIQAWVFKRRIRLHEFFLGFDTLRHGTISKQKFHTVISQAAIPLAGDEIECILKQFPVEGTDDLFNWRPFCKEVNEPFGPTELNRSPTGKIQAIGVDPEPSVKTQRLNDDQERFVRMVLKRMSDLVTTRRMNIKEQFLDYDKCPRKKYITKLQFMQCVARLGLSTNRDELNALCKKYRCTELDDVNYCAFCDDVDKSP